VENVLKRYQGPFQLKLSEEESEDLQEAIDTVRRIVHDARLVKDHAMNTRIVRYRAAKAARDDKPLQQFIERVQRGAAP
jgi:hypothetical protein